MCRMAKILSLVTAIALMGATAAWSQTQQKTPAEAEKGASQNIAPSSGTKAPPGPGGTASPALTEGECTGLGGKVVGGPIGSPSCGSVCTLVDKIGAVRYLCIDNVRH
jgi:hypothetical protein